MRSHPNRDFHFKRHWFIFFSHCKTRFLCYSGFLFVSLLWWEEKKKTFDDDEERASKFGLVFDIVYLMYATHSRAHHSLSRCHHVEQGKSLDYARNKKKSKWKSFKANFYVELTIFTCAQSTYHQRTLFA